MAFPCIFQKRLIHTRPPPPTQKTVHNCSEPLALSPSETRFFARHRLSLHLDSPAQHKLSPIRSDLFMILSRFTDSSSPCPPCLRVYLTRAAAPGKNTNR